MNHTYLPPRRKRQKINPRPSDVVRCDGHLQWVRGHECAIAGKFGHTCEGSIRACHYRLNGNGGTGMKPGDDRTWPGCDGAHSEQHRIGELSFQIKYLVDLEKICAELWRVSPHGIKCRATMMKE